MPSKPAFRGRVRSSLVAVFTFGSIIIILAVWLRLSQGTILWAYSTSITTFLLVMYTITGRYRPTEDIGFRPRVTVVIPVKNEEAIIESVIRTVMSSDYPSSEMDVIAVDDGSTDRTWEMLQRARSELDNSGRLMLIKHPRNLGKRVALASAITVANGEVIVCIDSDSFVEKDAIRLLVQPLQNQNVTAVCGHGEAMNKDEGFLPKLQHFWYAEMFRLLKGMESCLGAVSCCSGMLAAYRKRAIMPVIEQWLSEKRSDIMPTIEGLTSPLSLSSGLTAKLIKSPGEDRILTAFALSHKDAKVVYQSNAVVRTMVPSTMRQFLRQQLRWNRAWIHGSLFASRFMWRKSVAASLMFYFYQALAVLSPAIVIYWLFVSPFQGAWAGAVGFLAGTLYVGFLHGLNTWNYRETTLASVGYRMIFVFLSFVVTLTALLYGWATPWKMGWVTRAEGEDLRLGERALQPVALDPISA